MGIDVGVDLDIDVGVDVLVDVDADIDVGVDDGVGVEDFGNGGTALLFAKAKVPNGFKGLSPLSDPSVLFVIRKMFSAGLVGILLLLKRGPLSVPAS